MKSLRSALPVLVCALTLFPAIASAQTETEPSDVVGRGIANLDMGTTFESSGAAAEFDRATTFPMALLRIGVSRRFELRVGSDGYIVNSYGSGLGQSTTRGQTDIQVGASYVVREGGDGRFALAIIPLASLPTGADGLTSGSVDPTVKFAWSTGLPKDFEIAGNVNLSRVGDDLGRYTERLVSASLSHDLKADWGGYWEAYGVLPQGRADSAAWTLHTGVTHGVGGNAVIDLSVGRGITAPASDWFVRAGVGVRTALLRRRQ